jgi:hypothetical protein
MLFTGMLSFNEDNTVLKVAYCAITLKLIK